MPKAVAIALVVLAISLGPVGGLLIGMSDRGSSSRTVGFILLGLFFVSGIALNIVAVRRSRQP